jgi:ABC-type tungstate transport system substrate-binding protein
VGSQDQAIWAAARTFDALIVSGTSDGRVNFGIILVVVVLALALALTPALRLPIRST